MLFERCLIVDVETTSLDPETGHCTEVAAILYSLTNRAEIASFSMLTGHVSDDVLVQALTGIVEPLAREAKNTVARNGGVIKALMHDLSGFADCLVAHNAAFDRQWLDKATNSLPWLCTFEDFKFPGVQPGMSLTALALALGVPVVSAHRALTDCRLIASIFSRCAELGHDLQELFRIAQRPKSLFVAVDDGNFFSLSKAEQERRTQERRLAGFKWHRIVPKKWARRMPAEDTAALPFAVRGFQGEGVR